MYPPVCICFAEVERETGDVGKHATDIHLQCYNEGKNLFGQNKHLHCKFNLLKRCKKICAIYKSISYSEKGNIINNSSHF